MRTISSLVTWLALAWLSLVCPVVSAENPTDRKVVQITRLGGLVIGPDSFDVRVVGNFAYVAAGFSGLKVIDVRDPSKPLVVGSLDTAGRARAVEVVGTLVYLADYEGGLVIVDVSNPAQPLRVGGFDTRGSARSVRVAGNYAYVADYDAGLQVLDVSNPSSPVLVGNFDTVGNSRGVRLEGDLAFVADETNGLQIINIIDPKQPVRAGGIDTVGSSFDSRVVDNFAYVADWDAGLQIVDVRDPSAPALVGSYDTPGAALSVQVVGNYAYLADANYGLLAVDVSHPSLPVLAGAFDTPGIAYGINVVGNLAFLAESSDLKGGLQIFQLREGIEQTLALELPTEMTFTNAPLLLPTHTSSGLRVSYSVLSGPAIIADGHLKLTGAGVVSFRAEQAGTELVLPLLIEQTIRVLPNQTLTWLTPGDDILALNTPHLLSVTVNSGLPVTFRVISGPGIIQSGALVITNGGSVTVEATQDGSAVFAQTSLLKQFNRGITIPTLVGTFNTKGTAVGVDVVENLAYVADSAAGLQIIDVTSVTTPTLVGSYDTSGSAYRVQVVGRYAYIADGASGLQIVDVSNPIQPVRVGGFDTPGSARSLQVAGNYAYVADGDAGLQVLDVSNPSSPLLVGGLDTDGFTEGVHFTGDLGYLADRSALRVIDLSSPEHPLLVQSVSRTAHSVVSSGRYVFPANGANSFEVLEFGSSSASPAVGGAGLAGISADLVTKDVGIDDDSAYVATFGAGLQVMDIRDPLHPLRGARIDTPGQAVGVRVVGNRAFVADGNAGLQIFSLRKGIDQVLTLPLAAEVTFTNAPFSLPDVSSRGLPVTYRVVSGPAQVEGNVLRLTGTGTLVVRAEQAGTDLFLPAEAERTMQVVLNQSLTWLSPTNSIVSPFRTVGLTASSSAGLPVTFSVVSGPATVAGKRLSLTGEGSVTVRASQAGDSRYAPAEVERTFVFQFQPLAKVSLDPLSIVLHPAETTGGNAILFTTFDGTSGLPLFDSVFGQTLVSGEVNLLSNPTNTWATDYITGLEYGSLTFSDPTADSDTNGLPDLAEQAKAIDRSFAATLRQDSPTAGRTIQVQLRLTRNEATSEGDYSATATTPLGPITYEGKWWAGHFETIAEFDRMRRELKLNLSLEDPSGRTRILKATVPYSRGTDGSLILPAFAAEQTVDGLASGAVQFPTVRLPWQSDARAFRGPLKLVDGNTETSWPDMTDYIMTVFDPGDRDGDGIANMVDEWIQPSVQILSDSAGTIIHLEIRAELGEQLSVETSTDLSQWIEAGQLTGQGPTTPAQFDLPPIDSDAHRFWRIRGQ